MEESAVRSLYKKWWFWLIVVFIVSAVLNAQGVFHLGQIGIYNSPDLPGSEYQKVFTFSGSGAKNSEPFTIHGDRFKITYECTQNSITVLCQAFLYNVQTKLPQIVMNSNQATKDETVIYGSGEYYISSNVIGNFTMTVYEYR